MCAQCEAAGQVVVEQLKKTVEQIMRPDKSETGKPRKAPEPTEEQLAVQRVEHEGYAFAEVLRALAPLEPDARRRVLRWATERFTPSPSPSITVTVPVSWSAGRWEPDTSDEPADDEPETSTDPTPDDESATPEAPADREGSDEGPF